MNEKVLQDCKICDNGTACQCLISARLNPGLPPMACGCMGFRGCPSCGRKSPYAQ